LCHQGFGVCGIDDGDLNLLSGSRVTMEVVRAAGTSADVHTVGQLDLGNCRMGRVSGGCYALRSWSRKFRSGPGPVATRSPAFRSRKRSGCAQREGEARQTGFHAGEWAHALCYAADVTGVAFGGLGQDLSQHGLAD
jgi:hypothetical protein